MLLPIELSQASALPCGRPDALPPQHTHGLSRARTRAPTRRQDPHSCLCRASTRGVLCLRWKLLSLVLHILLPLVPPYILRAPGPDPGLGIRAKLPRRLCSEDASSLQVRGRRGYRAPGRVRGARAARKDPSLRAGGKLVRERDGAATPPTPQRNRPKGHRGAL